VTDVVPDSAEAVVPTLDPEVGEECGVFGVWAPGEEVAKLAYYGIFALQHRGQEAAGIAVSDGHRARVHKQPGLVSHVFTNETLAQRIASWTGLTVTTQSPAADLAVDWQNAAYDTATVRKIYRGGFSLGSLLDTLRAEAKLRNMTFLYQPLLTPQFILKPNNQWLTGTGSTALTFSDSPAHVMVQPIDPTDLFTHTGRYVGYSERTEGMDVGLFTNAATIRYGEYDVSSPPPNDVPVEVVSATYRASGANQRDVVVDLGTLDVAAPGSNPYWLSRAVTSVLPLKANPEPFTTSLKTPLQSVQQLQGTVPGMALLEHDGITERVAVLGRNHEITPDKWMINYTLGPPHLLDRTSDFDPATPEVHPAVAGPGGGQTTFEWVTPAYPTDAVIYEVVFTASDLQRLITSDQALVGVADYPVAFAPGTLRQLFLSGVAGTDYWVLYTSNTAPGTVNPSSIWREGAPAYLGELL